MFNPDVALLPERIAPENLTGRGRRLALFDPFRWHPANRAPMGRRRSPEQSPSTLASENGPMKYPFLWHGRRETQLRAVSSHSGMGDGRRSSEHFPRTLAWENGDATPILKTVLGAPLSVTLACENGISSSSERRVRVYIYPENSIVLVIPRSVVQTNRETAILCRDGHGLSQQAQRAEQHREP